MNRGGAVLADGGGGGARDAVGEPPAADFEELELGGVVGGGLGPVWIARKWVRGLGGGGGSGDVDASSHGGVLVDVVVFGK